ncbi:hypothetical protein ACFV1H_18735 [Streptomyces virginiae]|uniref:hypothetical protein n=1 Tax=Streptomyces virginiae TaxID=1961 RepID=UPI003684D360
MTPNTPTPPIGRWVYDGLQQCSYSPNDTPASDCNQPATWHILWGPGDEHSLACTDHMAYVDRSYTYFDRHHVCPDCCMPDAVWLEIEKRCIYPDHPAPALAVARAINGSQP